MLCDPVKVKTLYPKTRVSLVYELLVTFTLLKKTFLPFFQLLSFEFNIPKHETSYILIRALIFWNGIFSCLFLLRVHTFFSFCLVIVTSKIILYRRIFLHILLYICGWDVGTTTFSSSFLLLLLAFTNCALTCVYL